MKIVLNRCFGGYDLPEDIYEELGLDPIDMLIKQEHRSDPRLIKYVEDRGGMVKLETGRTVLMIFELPDNMTDYRITDHMGVESVYYVIDGKIHSLEDHLVGAG